MASVCEVPEATYRKLLELAERLGVTVEEAARAAIARGLEVSTRAED